MHEHATITLKPGKEKPVLQGHPWVFSGAIAAHQGGDHGAPAAIHDAAGQVIAHGYFNSLSKIPVRVLTLDAADRIGPGLIHARLDQALARRQPLLRPEHQTSARLVMSEADLLPGLIIDRYGDVLVLQSLTAGMDRMLPWVLTALQKLLPGVTIYERSDDDMRRLEGLEPRTGVLAGSMPAGPVDFLENGLRFQAVIASGHKTGYYLDQRQNHALARARADGRHVLDCFSYTGGFSVHALAGGAAHSTAVDASAPALEQLRQNARLNDLPADRITTLQGNAFEVLRALRDQNRQYDLVILDPPKFAANRAQVDKAARGYKDINMLGLKLLKPGGLLMTYSCSGHISADLFQKIVFGALCDTGRHAHLTGHLFQATDHPILMSFPESLYLKGLMLQMLD